MHAIRDVAGFALLAMFHAAVALTTGDAKAQTCQIQSFGSQARSQTTCGGAPSVPGPSVPAPSSPSPGPSTPPSSPPPSSSESIVLRFQTPGDPTSSTPLKIFQIDSAQVDAALGRPVAASLIAKWKTRINGLNEIIKRKIQEKIDSAGIPIVNIKIKKFEFDYDPFIVDIKTGKLSAILDTSVIHATAVLDVDAGLASILTIPFFCFDPEIKVTVGISLTGQYDFLTGILGNFDVPVIGPSISASCAIPLSPLNPLLDVLAEELAGPLIVKEIHKFIEDLEDTQIRTAFGLNDIEAIIPRITDPVIRDIAQQALPLLRSSLSKGSGLTLELTFDEDFFGPKKHAFITEVRQQGVSGFLETFRASRVFQATDVAGATLFDIYLRGSENSPWVFWKSTTNVSWLSLGWIPPGAGIMIVSYNRLIPVLRSRPAVFIAGGPAYPGGAK